MLAQRCARQLVNCHYGRDCHSLSLLSDWHMLSSAQACGKHAKALGMLQNLSHGVGESAQLEQYMDRILGPTGQMGLLELLAFMMSRVGDSSTQDLCVQLWLPDHKEPLFLTNLPSTELTESSRSRRTFVCNLLAVTLPKSQQVVWLPLDNAVHTEITGLWEQRLNDLDEQIVTANLEEASASGSKSQSPAQSTIPGLRARGRRQGGGVGHSKMTSSKRARRG